MPYTRYKRVARIRMSLELMQEILMGGGDFRLIFPVTAPEDMQIEFVEMETEGILEQWFYIYISSDEYPIVEGDVRKNAPLIDWPMRQHIVLIRRPRWKRVFYMWTTISDFYGLHRRAQPRARALQLALWETWHVIKHP